MVSIITGIIAGLISGLIIYYYSEQRATARKIIEYAERTADKVRQILEEAEKCLEGKDKTLLEQFINKRVRRNFAGKIVDKTEISQQLQRSIAACNCGISQIEVALEGDNVKTELLFAVGELNKALVDIENAIIDYKVADDRKREKEKDIIKRILVSVFAIALLTILAICFASYSVIPKYKTIFGLMGSRQIEFINLVQL